MVFLLFFFGGIGIVVFGGIGVIKLARCSVQVVDGWMTAAAAALG